MAGTEEMLITLVEPPVVRFNTATLVTVPLVVMRPIRFGVVSVYQSAPSEPVAMPEGSPLPDPALNIVIDVPEMTGQVLPVEGAVGVSYATQ